MKKCYLRISAKTTFLQSSASVSAKFLESSKNYVPESRIRRLGIENLVERWEEVVNNKGEYIID